jgi:hypothetical protein
MTRVGPPLLVPAGRDAGRSWADGLSAQVTFASGDRSRADQVKECSPVGGYPYL